MVDIMTRGFEAEGSSVDNRYRFLRGIIWGTGDAAQVHNAAVELGLFDLGDDTKIRANVHPSSYREGGSHPSVINRVGVRLALSGGKETTSDADIRSAADKLAEFCLQTTEDDAA